LALGLAASAVLHMKAAAGPISAATITLAGGEGGIVICAFDAAAIDGGIQLVWETCTEFDTLAFNLYRSDQPDEEPVRLNECLIPAKFPGQPIGATYYYTDVNVEAGHAYFYWVDSLDFSGNPTRHGPVEATAYYRVYMPLVQHTCSDILRLLKAGGFPRPRPSRARGTLCAATLSGQCLGIR
jgi:hypothetical protein